MKILTYSAVSLIVILLVISSVLLLKPQTKALQIFTLNNVHSYAYTSNTETFTIPLLLNDKTSLYTIETAIESVYIQSSDERHKIPITLENIHYVQANRYDNLTMHHYNFEFKIGVNADDLTINIEDAELVLHANDASSLTLNIGTFNYTFMSLNTDDIILEDRVNMSESIHQFPTSIGIIITVNNQTAHAIEILNIDLNTSNVIPNMRHVEVYNEPIYSMISIEDALGYNFDYNKPPAPQAQRMIIEPNSKITYVVPFSYTTFKPLHRYPLIIEYAINNEVKTQCFDDFSYIKTDPFFVLNDALHSEYKHDSD